MIKSVTIILILINVVFFFLEPKRAGFSIDIADPFNKLFQFTPATAFDMPWTFITSIFMHGDLLHLFFNMFVLFMFGLVLESRLKSHSFLIFYLVAGIVGNLVYMAMAFSGIFPLASPSLDPTMIPGVGASGAILGILGVLGIITPRIPIFIPIIPIPVPMYIGVIIFAIFNIAISFVPSGIGTGAHLGGLAIGVLYGLWLRHQINRRRNVRVTYVWE